MGNDRGKGSGAFRLVGYRHLHLKIFLSFLFAMAAATGCLLIAFAYQGQGTILFWSLFLLHTLEIVCSLYCYCAGKVDALAKQKRLTLLMGIYYVLLAFLAILLILEGIAFAKPDPGPNPLSEITSRI